MNRKPAVLTWMAETGWNRSAEGLAMTGLVSLGVFLLLRVIGLG
jgi:hypothetical protein